MSITAAPWLGNYVVYAYQQPMRYILAWCSYWDMNGGIYYVQEWFVCY